MGRCAQVGTLRKGSKKTAEKETARPRKGAGLSSEPDYSRITLVLLTRTDDEGSSAGNEDHASSGQGNGAHAAGLGQVDAVLAIRGGIGNLGSLSSLRRGQRNGRSSELVGLIGREAITSGGFGLDKDDIEVLLEDYLASQGVALNVAGVLVRPSEAVLTGLDVDVLVSGGLDRGLAVGLEDLEDSASERLLGLGVVLVNAGLAEIDGHRGTIAVIVGVSLVAEAIHDSGVVADLGGVLDGDLLVSIKGKSFQEIALFVAKRLSPLDDVLSTATSFVLRTYKRGGRLYLDEETDDREWTVL